MAPDPGLDSGRGRRRQVPPKAEKIDRAGPGPFHLAVRDGRSVDVDDKPHSTAARDGTAHPGQRPLGPHHKRLSPKEDIRRSAHQIVARDGECESGLRDADVRIELETRRQYLGVGRIGFEGAPEVSKTTVGVAQREKAESSEE